PKGTGRQGGGPQIPGKGSPGHGPRFPEADRGRSVPVVKLAPLPDRPPRGGGGGEGQDAGIKPHCKLKRDSPMTDFSADRNPVEQLAEEFGARQRRGERPDLEEYTARYPQWADEIRELFPALALMEDLKPGKADVTGAYESAPEGAPGRRL